MSLSLYCKLIHITYSNSSYINNIWHVIASDPYIVQVATLPSSDDNIYDININIKVDLA